MSNFIISTIRTIVPIILGGVATWVAAKTGWILPEDLEAEAAVGVTGLVIGGYYIVVHWLEQKFPKLGWLLGKEALPYYDVVPPPDDAVGIQP
jgi:hypothetical protein